jgi:hypothetical protein
MLSRGPFPFFFFFENTEAYYVARAPLQFRPLHLFLLEGAMCAAWRYMGLAAVAGTAILSPLLLPFLIILAS